jgi:hypothetical protein
MLLIVLHFLILFIGPFIVIWTLLLAGIGVHLWLKKGWNEMCSLHSNAWGVWVAGAIWALALVCDRLLHRR